MMASEYDKSIYAEVVFDGVETYAPARMGDPADGQLQGTTHERLVELAGRVCYDSLGRGRSSADYHAHIREVNHGSVWEHANFTVEFTVAASVVNSGESSNFVLWAIATLMNRPGVWANVRNLEDGGVCLRVTLNLRAAAEWDTFEGSCVSGHVTYQRYVRHVILACARRVAPQIVPESLHEIAGAAILNGILCRHVPRGEVAHPEEKWVSLLLGGSRGVSHEQVRHKWRTAVSQRSTRYVDEGESPWVEHPLTTTWLALPNVPVETFGQVIGNVKSQARAVYETVAESQRGWLEANGVDKHTARKQARGAARGFLGNALSTEMIFSASVAQWQRMLEQRCTIHADAEIRVLYGKILQALRQTRWAEDFANYQLTPSPDGIGEVLRCES